MDLRYPPAAEAFRSRVRSFLAEQLPSRWRGIGALEPDDAADFVRQWRKTLFEHGFLGLAWPVEYGGGGMSKLEQVVLVEELARAKVPLGPPSDTISVKMIGNTLLRWGTVEQKQRFLPRILSADDSRTQGFSDPNDGSALPGLITSAVRAGDV